MLVLNKVSVRNFKDGFELINNLSFTLNPGDKFAIIGHEGTGKSTLLKLIYNAGLVPYIERSGQIECKGRIGYLDQDISLKWKETNVEMFFLKDLPEDEINYQLYEKLDLIPKLLDRVKFPSEDFDFNKKLGDYSGGEIVKLGILKLIFLEPDIFLLDEPTNDLDFETILFLEDFILNENKPILFVSHDERLLEDVANGIIHLQRVHKKTKAVSYTEKMSYNEYREYRLKQFDSTYRTAMKQREDHKQKLQRWRAVYQIVEHQQNQVVRDPSHARLLKKKIKSLQSQKSRYDKEKETFTPVPEKEETINIWFEESVELPKKKRVIDFSLEELKIGQKILASQIKLVVMGREKIVITGRNGSGKTTLIKKLLESLKDRDDISVGYMPQDYTTLLKDKNPLEFLSVETNRHREAEARKMLGALQFEREEMIQDTENLSGGQKVKLFFLKMVLSHNTVLILDEPTRNLSPLSTPEVYEMLKEYRGTIVCVSHDRAFIEAVFDTMYTLDSKTLKKC